MAEADAEDVVSSGPFWTGMLVIACSGSIYVYASMITGLEDTLGLSAKVVARCGTVLNVGTWLSFLPGLLVDARGPKPTLVLGAALTGGGFGALACLTAYADGGGGAGAAITCGSALFLVGLGSSCMVVAAVVTNANNTEARDRGPCLSVLMACFSLSSGVAGAWKALVVPGIADFLKFIACVVPLGALAGAAGVVALPPESGARASRRAARARLGVIAVAGVTLASTAWAPLDWVLLVASGGAYLACLCVVARIFTSAPDATSGAAGYDPRRERAPFLKAGDGGGRAPVEAARSLREAVRSREYWLLAAVYGVTVGTGVTVLDESAALVDSIRDDSSAELAAKLVAVFAACNTLSKLVAGAGAAAVESERRRGGAGRTCAGLLAAACVVMALGVGLLMAATRDGSTWTLILAVACVACAYGPTWVLVPLIARDVFGPTHYGAIHGSMSLALCAASLLLYSTLAADDLAAHEHGGGRCYNDPGCFAITLDVLFVLALLAALAATSLELHLQGLAAKTPPTVVSR